VTECGDGIARVEGLPSAMANELLEFEDGSESVRFCYYDHTGRFQRSPMIVGKEEIEGMRKALAGTPRLSELLRKMIA